MPLSLPEQEHLLWFQGQWKKAQAKAQKTKKATRSAAANDKEDYEQDCQFSVS